MKLTWTYTTLDNLPPVLANVSEELQPGQCGGMLFVEKGLDKRPPGK